MPLLSSLAALGYPSLEWIQVGITTKCNAACIYCPHPMLEKAGRSRHMSMKIFTALSPAFARSGMVYLQGWGEPMLHPEFMSMLKMVKQKGSRAGATSNASLLTEDRIRRLVDEGLDVLGLSVAGVDMANDSIRPGSPLEKVQKSVEMVHRIKAAKGSAAPMLHLAYMLLASRRKDIPQMSGFFNALGMDQIVVSSLTLAINREMEKEIYPAEDRDDFERFKDELKEMRSRVDGMEKVFFHICNPYLSGGMCSENIQRACYVDVDGRVLPCVYTDVTEEQKVHRYFRGERHLLYPLEFGQLSRSSLKRIWREKEYLQFREQFPHGSYPEVCRSCCKRFIDDLS